MIKYLKFGEIKEAFAALFSRCFPKRTSSKEAPGKGNVFRCRPVANESSCVGCEACSEVCPAGAVVIEDNPSVSKRIIKRFYDRCIFCGLCETSCPQPEPGVVLTGEYDLADYTTKNMCGVQEFKLAVCSKCGGSIATTAQLRATIKRIGPAAAYSNPNLVLFRQSEISSLPPSKKHKEYNRSDIMVFLCPACRHKVYVAEISG